MLRYLLSIIVLSSLNLAFGQDVAGEVPKWTLRRPEALRQVAYLPDGKRLLSAGEDGKVLLWDVAAQKILREYVVRGRPISGASGIATLERRRIEWIAVSPDGATLAESATDTPLFGSIRLWPIEGGPAHVLEAKAFNPRCVVFSPDGKWIVANMRDGEKTQHKLVIWDAATKKVVRELRDDRLAASLIAFSPDGATLASAGGTKLVLWDFESGKVRSEIRGHKKGIQFIAFGVDGTKVGTVSDDDMVHVWNVGDGTLEKEWKLEQGGVMSVAFTTTSRTVATAGKDKTIKLWNPTSGRRLKTLFGHEGRVNCLAFSPDGKTLTSGGADGLIAFWNIDEPSYKEQDDKKTPEEIEADKKRRAFEKEKKKREGGDDKPPGGRP